MKGLTIKIPDDLRARLLVEAARRGMSVGALVREASETYVTATPVATATSAHDLARDLCGTLAPGVNDLSTNEKHLEELGLDSMGDSGYRAAGGVPRPRGTRSRVGR
jgi:plasmid stability protein